MSPRSSPSWLASLPALECCILCERARYVVGIFEPFEPWLYHPAPLSAGKVRRLAYALCRRCFRRPDRCEAVEAECRRRMGGP